MAERAVVLAVPDLVSALGIVPACPTYHLLLHLLRARRGARPAGSLSCTVHRMSASPEVLEEAKIEATLAAHDEWVAAGCPGARSHEDVMAELLGGDQ